jgi:hypothetical protein
MLPSEGVFWLRVAPIALGGLRRQCLQRALDEVYPRPRGHATARLADGTRIAWRRGEWELPAVREITVAVRDALPLSSRPCTSAS